jgi:hypothetical protein
VVNSFETGEWLAYTINVTQGGSYDLAIRASNGGAEAIFHMEIDGVNVTQSVPVPSTGSVDTFQWFTKPGVTLLAGPHVLKLVSDQQLFNVNQIRISPTPPPGCNAGDLRPYGGTPVNGFPIEIAGSGSTTFEAEYFNCGGENVAYHDDTSANDGDASFRTGEGVDIGTSSEGNVVKDTRNGEWLTYTINVLQGGTYDLAIRASNSGATATFHMEIGGSPVTPGVSVTNTGSTFQWFTSPAVELVAGTQVLKVFVDQQSFNMNQLRITRAGTGPECSGDNVPTQTEAGAPAGTLAMAVPTFHSMGLYYKPAATPPNCTTTDNSGCKVWMSYRKACETAWREGFPMWFDPRTGGDLLPFEYRARGSAVHLKPGTKYYFKFGTGPSSWQHHVAGTTWSEDFDVELTKKITDGTWNCSSTGPCVIGRTEGGTGGKYRIYDGCLQYNASGKCEAKHLIDRGGNGKVEVADPDEDNIYTPDVAHGIVVDADFVIVRNVKVTGAAMAGIHIKPGIKNVVIEDTEIWDWAHQKGEREADNEPNPNEWGEWGWNEVGAIHVGARASSGSGSNNESIVIQRNIIGEPHLGAFPWDTGGTSCLGTTQQGYPQNHPTGPNGISVANAKQQIVIRYNEISGRPADASKSHRWLNDGIGGKSNASARGSPGADSDIYQNIIMGVFDDAIEAEGGGRNVRIWGNYISDANAGIAAVPVHYGPHYVWRNVVNRIRKCSHHIVNNNTDGDRETTAAFKYNGAIDEDGFWGGGMRYIFNNTILQEDVEPGIEPGGAATGINSNDDDAFGLTRTMGRNNILHVRKPGGWSLYIGSNVIGFDFSHNIYNGEYDRATPSGWKFNDPLTYRADPGQPVHGPKSVPLPGGVGNYQQSATGFGRHKGTHIPNFTYDIEDEASAARSGYEPTPSATCTATDVSGCPDTGAHQYRVEAGGSMKFGKDAGK